MIEITISERNHEVSVKGHAGFDEVGKDIVCAGASILFFAFAEAVHKAGTLWEFRAEKGDCYCKFAGSHGDMKKLQVLKSGAQLLEAQYPENVRVIGGEKSGEAVCYDEKKEVSACT